jgi:hypothetical protein
MQKGVGVLRGRLFREGEREARTRWLHKRCGVAYTRAQRTCAVETSCAQATAEGCGQSLGTPEEATGTSVSEKRTHDLSSRIGLGSSQNRAVLMQFLMCNSISSFSTFADTPPPPYLAHGTGWAVPCRQY